LDSENVVLDIEIVVDLPRGMTEVKRVGCNFLLIARQQRQSRIEVCDKFPERYLTLEDAHTADVHRRFFLFEVEKCGVRGAEPGAETWPDNLRIGRSRLVGG